MRIFILFSILLGSILLQNCKSNKVKIESKFGQQVSIENDIVKIKPVKNRAICNFEEILDFYTKHGLFSYEFTNGDYYFSKPLLINEKNIKIKGNVNTEFIYSGTKSMFVLKNADGFSVSHINFKSTNVNPKKEIYCFETLVGTISNNINISNCTFSGTNQSSGFNNILYLRNGCKGTIFSSNVINNLLGDESGNGYGVLCTACSDSNFSKNKMYGKVGLGRHAFYLSAGARNNIVENNEMYDISVSAISIAAKGNQQTSQNNIIRNNIFKGGVSKYINCGMLTLFGNVNDNIVKNNTFIDSGSYGIINNATFADGKERSNGTIINKNTFKNIYRASIFLGGVKNVTVKDNSFENISIERKELYAPIVVTSDINLNYGCENISISGNKSLDKSKIVKIAKSKVPSKNIRIKNQRKE